MPRRLRATGVLSHAAKESPVDDIRVFTVPTTNRPAPPRHERSPLRPTTNGARKPSKSPVTLAARPSTDSRSVPSEHDARDRDEWDTMLLTRLRQVLAGRPTRHVARLLGT